LLRFALTFIRGDGSIVIFRSMPANSRRVSGSPPAATILARMLDERPPVFTNAAGMLVQRQVATPSV